MEKTAATITPSQAARILAQAGVKKISRAEREANGRKGGFTKARNRAEAVAK